MREHRYKIFCIIYMLLVASLSIGWYPETEAENISSIIREAGNQVEAMCMLKENNRLFLQGIQETEEEQRQLYEQMDENRRRAVQTIKRIKQKKKTPVPGVGKEGRRILERIVEAEAGDQNVKGRRLVANVVLNRVKSKHFPNTVKSVVFAPRQFSPVSNGRYYRVRVSQKTKIAVKQALNGKNDSKGALYFMCRSASSPANVAWFDRDLTRLFAYGCHEFFR
ncbi:MAG: cell wall hydrolase [Lachnospiraceae bacterium]|nr:cell wall hydrolase [Lachnospiraceae bacterium]